MSHWLSSNPELTHLLCPGETPQTHGDTSENFAVFQQTQMIPWGQMTLFNLINGPRQNSGLYYTDQKSVWPVVDGNKKPIGFACDFRMLESGVMTFTVGNKRWVMIEEPFVHAKPIENMVSEINQSEIPYQNQA